MQVSLYCKGLSVRCALSQRLLVPWSWWKSTTGHMGEGNKLGSHCGHHFACHSASLVLIHDQNQLCSSSDTQT